MGKGEWTVYDNEVDPKISETETCASVLCSGFVALHAMAESR